METLTLASGTRVRRADTTCRVCGDTFSSPVRRNASGFCSDACRLRDYYARNPIPPRPPRTLTCAWCDASFDTTERRVKFCPDCSSPAIHTASRRMVTRRAVYAATTTGDFSALDIFKRDGWTCGICREPIDRSLRSPDPGSPSVDHIVPLDWGGEHKRENVRAAHLLCNTTKLDGGNLIALLAAA